MNKKQTGKFGVLAVTLLLIISFVKGEAEIIALLTAVFFWLLWAFFPYFKLTVTKIAKFLKNAILTGKARRLERRKVRLLEKLSPVAETVPVETPISDSASQPVKMETSCREQPILLASLIQQLNLRITDKLHCQFPDATWSWCEDHPEELAISGGATRIQVSGAESFNYADVTMNTFGQLRFDMLHLVPLEQVVSTEDNKQQPQSNVEAGYDLQWRPVLLDLIKELTPHGHKRLFITTEGEVCVYQGDKQQTKGSLTNFPQKENWNKIGELLKQDKLQSKINGDVLVVLW